MAYPGVLDDIRASVSLRKPNRLPVFACSEEFDVRMAGMVYNEYNRDPKLMAKCQVESVRRFGYDWAWLQVDDCIEFEVLGVGCRGEGNILPATCDYLPATWETLRGLPKPDFARDGRMPVLLEAIKRIKDELGDTVCVTGRVAAPFSSVTLLFGMTETLMLMYDEPELVLEAVKRFTDLQTRFGLAQIAAGADALWVGDCNASGHLISVDQYREFAFDGVGACVSAYREAGGFSFYHASEHSLPHLAVQAETGIDALSVGPGRDMAEAKACVGDRICLIGNIDPIEYLLNRDSEAVCREAARIAAVSAADGGHLFNSGEMIPRETPEANIHAMIRGARHQAGA
jgi:uroporphyrinogen decarboxylase